MTTESDPENSKRRFSFAPRSDAAEAEANRRPVRASLLFILLGLVLTVGTVLWLGVFIQPSEIRLDVTDVKIDETGDVELTGAVYQKRTQQGEAFEITAEVASERLSGVVDMDKPTAQLYRNDGDLVDLESRNGIYYPDSSTINLRGDVVVKSQNLGITLLALSLSANLDEGSMVSNEPVRMERSDGVVTANAMEVSDRGKRIIFKGDARMTLHNDANDQ